MFKSRGLRDAVVMGWLVLLVLATGLWAQGPATAASDPLLKMVPAESLFCVRLNHLNYTLSQTDQFLAGVSPVPMGLSMLVRIQLAQVLGSPELNGLDMDGSFAVFGAILPGGPTQTNPIRDMFVGVLAPVTDYGQFIEGNPHCSQPDANGVSKITSIEMPSMLVTRAGSCALVSWANDAGKLVAMAKAMSSSEAAGLVGALDAAEAQRATGEPIWAYVDVQQVSKAFGPVVSGKLEQMRAAIKDLDPNRPGAPPMNVQNVIDMYSGILETLMKETRSFSIAINPKPHVLTITQTLSAVPGTQMANMFVSDASAPQENKLLPYLEDGAMINFGLNMSTPFWKKLNVMGIDLLATMAGDSMTSEDAAKMKALATDAIDNLGGPAAWSISMDAQGKPPFTMKSVIAVKDEEKFNRLVEQGSQMWNTSGMADFYKNLGMETSFTTKRGVDRYEGIPIDSATFTMKSTDANAPQGQMINAMYGDGFDYRWAMVNGLCVFAMGGDVNSAIRQMIDQARAGGPKQMGAEMKAALALLPEADKADFVGTYNFLRLFKMIAATAPVPVPVPQMDIPTRSNIVVAGKAGNGKMVVDIALPKEHLAEIMTGVMMMQQKMMQPKQEQQQMREAPGRSGIESISEEDMAWVKCNNPDCEAAYQMGKREYYETIEKRMDPMALSVPALVCKTCGEESIYRAEKCGKCGLIFLRGAVANDFPDRCPQCRYSEIEEQRKQRLKVRQSR